MTMMLVAADKTVEVEQLTDVDPNWQGIKLETKADQTIALAVGSMVTLQADDTQLAGDYKVKFVLGPAAPRGWRLFLEADRKVTRTEGPNTEKVFLIKVSAVTGDNVRRSVIEYKVPYSRLSQEVQRITRSGSKIINIAETNGFGNFAQ